jgi:hypothetical protein
MSNVGHYWETVRSAFEWIRPAGIVSEIAGGELSKSGAEAPRLPQDYQEVNGS